jgi:hypothetical protein
MPTNVTSELFVKLVIRHTLHRIHETGVKRNPVTNLTSVKTAIIQPNLKTTVAEISPPVDKLEPVSTFGKVLDMLAVANFRTFILRAATHRIATSVRGDKFLPHRVRLTIRIGDTQTLFGRVLRDVNMDMKPATAINFPTPLFGNTTKVTNLLKSCVTLQNRRNELFPRCATFVHATPFGLTMQVHIILAVGSFKLDAKPALRTDLIERTRLTTPRLSFPNFRVAVTLLTEGVAVPAAILTTKDSTTTLATRRINRIKALTTQKLLVRAAHSTPTIVNLLTHDTGEPIVSPASVADVCTLSRVGVAAIIVATVSTPACGTNLINGFVAREAAGSPIGTGDNFARFPVTIQSNHFTAIRTSDVMVSVTPCAEIAPTLDVAHKAAGAITAATTDTRDGLERVERLRHGLGVEPCLL